MNTAKIIKIVSSVMAKTEILGWVNPMDSNVHAEAWEIAKEAAKVLGYENIPAMLSVEGVGTELLAQGFVAGYFFEDDTVKVTSAPWLRLPSKLVVGLMAHEFLHAIQAENGLKDEDIKTGFGYAQSRHEREAYGVSYAVGCAGTGWMPVFLAARKGSRGFQAHMAGIANQAGSKMELSNWLEANLAPFIVKGKKPSMKEGFGLAKGFAIEVFKCYSKSKNFDYSF